LRTETGIIVGKLTLYQLIEWLQTDIWHPFPLEVAIGVFAILALAGLAFSACMTGYALPLSILFIVIGFLMFWAGGLLSAYLYKRAARVEAKPVTPPQGHA
jgi:hypothetical protein